MSAVESNSGGSTALSGPSLLVGESATTLSADTRRAAHNRAQQKNGSYRFLDLETAEWLSQLETTAYCLFCPGLTFTGTAEACVAWNQQHRAQAHPTLRSVSQKQRQIAARSAR